MINEQTIKDIIPYVWPSNHSERISLCQDIKQELEDLLIQAPQYRDLAMETMQNLSSEGPYFELIEQFSGSKGRKHKLFDVLNYLHNQGSNSLTLNLLQPMPASQLQKVVCDSYRLYNRRILNYQCKILTFSKYYKTSLSTLKKCFNEMYVDYNTINFVCAYATRHCPILTQLWQDFDDQQEKYQKLAQSFQKLEKMQHPDDLTHYFNRQQLILIYSLFSLMQCEEMIAMQFGETTHHLDTEISPEQKTTDDFSWNINGFSQIRDYFPKLAHKLNKRMKILKDLQAFTSQERISIYFYAQNLLGYQRNNDNTLNEQFRTQINDILLYQQVECDPALVILVSNAKLYTQILYSLM